MMSALGAAWKLVWTLAVREVVSMFRVPAGWIIIALFAFLSAVLFLNQTLVPGQPGSLRYFFTASAWLLIPIAPAISMRLMAEEYRTGSFESLRTTPAGDWSVAIGKYLGSVLFLVLMLAPSLVYPIVLYIVSDPMPDPGPIVAGYLMLLLVGSLYLSIGLLASSLTSSQTLAFLGTMMFLVLCMVLTSVLAPRAGETFAPILSKLSVISRAGELGKGVIDSGTILFFVIGSLWMVALTAGVLESRRLARSRWVLISMAGIFILATGTASVFAGFLADRHTIRIDVTSTSAHRLSPRAKNMVKALPGETRMILAINGMQQEDRLALDLVSDVLDAYERSSDNIFTEIIDLSSQSGIDQIERLTNELRSRDAGLIAENTSTLEQSSKTLDHVSSELNGTSSAINSIRDAIDASTNAGKTNRAFFEQRATLVRLGAADLNTASRSIAQDLQQTITLINAQLDQIEDLKSQLDAFASAPEVASAARSGARSLSMRLSGLIDDLAITSDQLTRLHTIDADRVQTALQTGEALLIIGPPETGISAIDLDAILPPVQALQDAGISPAGVIGPRAQELIASALARLVVQNHPIVVFVHAGDPGQLLSTPQLLTKTVARLKQRGIECVEWAALHETDRPSLASLDPIGQRPVVYVLISADSTTGGGDSGITGAKRATSLAQVATRLLDSGESVLISFNPSIFNSFGDTDPLAAALEPFGILADPSYTLLTQRNSGTKSTADPTTIAIPSVSGDDDSHLVSRAISGLSTVLPWSIPIGIDPRVGVETDPIITITGSESIWAEQDWLRFWSIPAQSRAYLEDQPQFDERNDLRRDRWTIAASASREHGIGTQRVIAVGSNSWLYDALSHGQSQLVDGRITTAFPGNLALLEGSIAWLAGLDELIAPGIESRPIATIKPMNSSQISLYRWILLAIVPGFVLMLGIFSRVVFG